MELIFNTSMLTWASLTAAFAIGAVVTTTMLRRLRPQSAIRNQKSAILDCEGTTTIEFTLVLPILGFMVMCMAQTTFLMAGNLFVNYAAFAATRSAIVQIPTAYADEPANVFTSSPGMSKYDAIQHAAAFALVPVAGRQTSANAAVDTAAYLSGLAAYYSAYNVNQPPWIESLAADRLRYALDNTQITVFTTQVNDNDVTFTAVPDGATQKFQPRDPITVQVSHKLNLSVPYVNAIFADGRNTNSPGRYRITVAKYTLSNEGILDTMPPKPTIPRANP